MRTTLLSTVCAAALALSCAAASAQTMDKSGGAGAPGATEKSAPAGETNKSEMNKGASPTQHGTMEHAQGATKPQERMENKAESGKPEGKAQNRSAQTGKSEQPAASTNSRMSSETNKMGAEKSANERTNLNAGKTVGAAPSSETKLTTEQRTQIREKVIATGPRVNHADFVLNVGTVVPRSVHFAALPPTIIDIYPDWRGRDYAYFIVNDQVVIVDRSSMQIVAVLEG